MERNILHSEGMMQVIARIDISLQGFQLTRNGQAVILYLQSRGLPIKGETIRVFDDRPLTLVAARAVNLAEKGEERQLARLALQKNICRPALVSIKNGKKTVSHLSSYLVSLKPTSKEPTALLSTTRFRNDSDNQFTVLDNNTLWHWKSGSRTASGHKKETLFVTLTAPGNCLSLCCAGPKNPSPTGLVTIEAAICLG